MADRGSREPIGSYLGANRERIRGTYALLPKTTLAREGMRRKLRVYAGAEHPHAAQQPTALTFSSTSE